MSTVFTTPSPRPLTLPLLSLTLPVDMRRDVQEIFKATPHEKQCMMFSATLPKEIRPVCKKFMNNVIPTLPSPPPGCPAVPVVA